MRNLLLGLLILISFSCNTTKQLKAPATLSGKEGYELKILFQPNSEYVSDASMKTNTSISITSMPDQVSETNITSTSTLKLGPLMGNHCKLEIVYDKMDTQMTGVGADQAETPNVIGMKIHGKLTDGVQSVDSIIGGDPSMHGVLEGMLEPMFSSMKIDFPNPMKIGESFLDTKEIDIPLEGMGSSTMITKTTYTLIKVTNDIADLTTQFKISGTMSIMGKEIPLDGSGSGTMTIDLKEQYSPSSSSIMEQNITMEMQGMTMEQKVKVESTTKTRKIK